MKDDFYGTVSLHTVDTEAQRVCEEVLIDGWSKVTGVVGASEIKDISTLVDQIYCKQEAEFGRDVLLACNEADQVRCLTRYDQTFLRLVQMPRLVAIATALLGEHYTLMLQNAVISRADNKNHQSSWHRDLPYQNFVSSEPLAINMLLVIDPFVKINGGTELLPYSHKLVQLPSEGYINRHKIAVTAEAGDMLIFDSMLYHRAGINRSDNTRRALNNQFAKPFIKPQYALHSIVPPHFIQNDEDRRLLGMASAVATDERDWRTRRISRQQVK